MERKLSLLKGNSSASMERLETRMNLLQQSVASELENLAGKMGFLEDVAKKMG